MKAGGAFDFEGLWQTEGTWGDHAGAGSPAGFQATVGNPNPRRDLRLHRDQRLSAGRVL